MFDQLLQLVCLYLIAYGMVLIVIETRVHLDRSFLFFALGLIGLCLFSLIDFWKISPSTDAADQKFWLIVQHVIFALAAIPLVWYFGAISGYFRTRLFVLFSILAILLALGFIVAPFFQIEDNQALPTLLYLVTVPAFVLGFAIICLVLIMRGLVAAATPMEKRIFHLHIFGFAMLLLGGGYDMLTFSFHLMPLLKILPNGSVLGLVVYGGTSTLLLTDRLAFLMDERNRFADLADTDPLTQAGNRRKLRWLLTQRVESAVKSTQTLSVIVLDIDHFKTYNDRYGHLVGDQLLQQVAGLVRTCLRADDDFVRYGGDEFVILSPRSDAAMITQIAERIRARVQDAVLSDSEIELHVTVSIGCATYLPPHDSQAQLIANADAALYESKQNGRNRVTLYHPV